MYIYIFLLCCIFPLRRVYISLVLYITIKANNDEKKTLTLELTLFVRKSTNLKQLQSIISIIKDYQ